LIALFVFGARRIAVCKLVDESHLGMASEHCFCVHFAQHHTFVKDFTRWNDLEVCDQFGSAGTVVSLNEANDDVGSARLPPMSLL